MINDPGKREFKQISHWFEESQQNWDLIDTHGAQILQFENIEAQKNDVKIKTQLAKLWESYLDSSVTSTDQNNASKTAKELI